MRGRGIKMPVIITDHAYEKGKERLGLKREAFERLAEKAFNQGLSHKDVAGTLERYFSSVYLSHRNANNSKVYGINLFLFRDNILITVYKLEPKLANLVLKLKAKNNK